MADKKISELESVISLGVTDLLPIVQENLTKKVSIGDLFQSAVDFSASGLFKLTGDSSQVTASGAISVLDFITQISNLTGSNLDLSLANGVYGQLKFITVINAVSTSIVTMNGNGVSTITFNASGQGCLLFFTDKWNIVSNVGGVIA